MLAGQVWLHEFSRYDMSLVICLWWAPLVALSVPRENGRVAEGVLSGFTCFGAQFLYKGDRFSVWWSLVMFVYSYDN